MHGPDHHEGTMNVSDANASVARHLTFELTATIEVRHDHSNAFETATTPSPDRDTVPTSLAAAF